MQWFEAHPACRRHCTNTSLLLEPGLHFFGWHVVGLHIAASVPAGASPGDRNSKLGLGVYGGFTKFRILQTPPLKSLGLDMSLIRAFSSSLSSVILLVPWDEPLGTCVAGSLHWVDVM